MTAFEVEVRRKMDFGGLHCRGQDTFETAVVAVAVAAAVAVVVVVVAAAAAAVVVVVVVVVVEDKAVRTGMGAVDMSPVHRTH